MDNVIMLFACPAIGMAVSVLARLGGTLAPLALVSVGSQLRLGAIVAIQYGLNAPLISLMVGVGTVLSFVTLPLWWNLFQLLGLG